MEQAPLDFESSASTSFTTPAKCSLSNSHMKYWSAGVKALQIKLDLIKSGITELFLFWLSFPRRRESRNILFYVGCPPPSARRQALREGGSWMPALRGHDGKTPCPFN
jgi:hypothetical protein